MRSMASAPGWTDGAGEATREFLASVFLALMKNSSSEGEEASSPVLAATLGFFPRPEGSRTSARRAFPAARGEGRGACCGAAANGAGSAADETMEEEDLAPHDRGGRPEEASRVVDELG